MKAWLRKYWPVIKFLLLLVVLGCVVWQFIRILTDPELKNAQPEANPAEILWNGFLDARPSLLLAGTILYLAAIGFSLVYWIGLVRLMGDRLPVTAAMRGYYVGHLAKYVPGKGLSLIMRVNLAVEGGVRPSVAALTAIYETLALMASGAIVAAVLFSTYIRPGRAELWHVLVLLAIALTPLLPGVFNRLVLRLAKRFLTSENEQLPQLGYRTLLGGLALLSLSWFLFGASLEITLCAFDPQRSFFDNWLQSTAFIAVAYIAGFFVPTSGGLGVREGLLVFFLEPELGIKAVVPVLLLRLLWVAGEVVMVGVAYAIPVRPRPASLTPSVPAS